jgi:hypothetical protein
MFLVPEEMAQTAQDAVSDHVTITFVKPRNPGPRPLDPKPGGIRTRHNEKPAEKPPTRQFGESGDFCEIQHGFLDD